VYERMGRQRERVWRGWWHSGGLDPRCMEAGEALNVLGTRRDSVPLKRKDVCRISQQRDEGARGPLVMKDWPVVAWWLGRLPRQRERGECVRCAVQLAWWLGRFCACQGETRFHGKSRMYHQQRDREREGEWCLRCFPIRLWSVGWRSYQPNKTDRGERGMPQMCDWPAEAALWARTRLARAWSGFKAAG